MTVKRKIVITAAVLCVLLIVVVVGYQKTHYFVNNADCVVEEIGNHPANDRQYNSPFTLFTWNGKLYVYPSSTEAKDQYYRELCVLEDTGIRSLGEMANLYAAKDGYVYYVGKDSPSRLEAVTGLTSNQYIDEQLMCYNLSTGEHTEIVKTGLISRERIHFEEDGTCYFPSDRISAGYYDQDTEYYIVRKGNLLGSNVQPETYTRGELVYTFEQADTYHFNLVCISPDASKGVLAEFSSGTQSVFLIPCDNGLLVYNYNSCDMLYYIPDDTGEIIELFAFEGIHSIGSVNVHGDWVYVSFNRYGSYKDVIGYIPIKNDTFEGTYRISLIDYSIEKLSDEVYHGMYIFDDTGIYACKESNIYKLDFDGNLISTLLK